MFLINSFNFGTLSLHQDLLDLLIKLNNMSSINLKTMAIDLFTITRSILALKFCLRV
jgi:hypothetical protein